MKTVYYYIAHQIKKSNGATVWYTSKNFDNLDDAHLLFLSKVKDGRTKEAHLYKCETWTDQSEIPFDPHTNKTPNGWRRTNQVESYDPAFFGGVKIWDID